MALPDWAALQAEVEQRVQSPRGQWRKVQRAHVAPLYPERFRQDGLLDDEANIQANQRFFLVGAAAQIGFLLAALVGLALLWVTPAQVHLAHAVLGWLGGARWKRLCFLFLLLLCLPAKTQPRCPWMRPPLTNSPVITSSLRP